MNKLIIALTAGVSLTTMLPAFSQGLFEGSSMDAMSAGLGAGLAASIGRGALVGRTYNSAVDAQMSAAQALQVRTKAIDQYMKLGAQYEARKQWQNAEKSFRYVLQVSTLRDGIGSPKMVPTLQHLVTVSSAQGNLYDAIGFQQRLVNFAKNAKVADPATVINAQMSLTDLYLKKQDYQSAEPVIRESFEKAQSAPGIAKEKRKVIARTYGQVLRKLNKESEAKQIEDVYKDSEPATTASSTALNGGLPTQATASTASTPSTSDSVATSTTISSGSSGSSVSSGNTANASTGSPAQPTPSPAVPVSSDTKQTATGQTAPEK